jgi:cyanate permease
LFAAVTFLILLVGAGVRATPSILLVPLEKEFGWSAATISAAIAVNIFLFRMIGPFAVAVMERFGLRRSVSLSLVILGFGVLPFSSEPDQSERCWPNRSSDVREEVSSH